MKDFLIILYYCYTPIEDPEATREDQLRLCIEKGLRGRVIVASEGINGTLSGLAQDCLEYMEYMRGDIRFASIDFKSEPHDGHAFEKINVRVKPEIVHSGLRHINPTQKTGAYLEPKDLSRFKESKDVVLLDVRSRYEHSIGRFRNSLTLDIDHFREFPEKVDSLRYLKDKVIVTYCTGGVKCEKASAYLLEKGFSNVYQLHGGIIKYSHETGGEDFEGKCYVFDNRVAVDVNRINPGTAGHCYVCDCDCNRMVNCANPECNRHIPLCEGCAKSLLGACSETCRNHPRLRPYDGTGYYAKQRKGYDPHKMMRVSGNAKKNRSEV